MSRKAAPQSAPKTQGGKRKGAGRPSEGRVRIVAYVLPATAALISEAEARHHCTPGRALDLLMGQP